MEDNRVEVSGGITGILAIGRERQLMNQKEVFRYSGIWIFSGQQGAGKTLLMMHTIQEIMQEYPKALLVSNMNIYGCPAIPYRGVEDFNNYNNGDHGIIFCIDEIQTLFSSLESKNMPVSQLTVWSQNRKNRRLILGTSQRFTRVSKPIREQCTWNYECHRPILNRFYSYRIFDGSMYDDNGNYKDEEPSRYWYVPRVSAMRMYDTKQIINREDYTKNGNNN